LTWSGVSWPQSPSTFTFADGGAWTPLTYLLWALVAIGAGRLWRVRARRRAAVAAA